MKVGTSNSIKRYFGQKTAQKHVNTPFNGVKVLFLLFRLYLIQFYDDIPQLIKKTQENYCCEDLTTVQKTLLRQFLYEGFIVKIS